MAEPIYDLFALFGPVPPHGAEPGTGAIRAEHTRHGVAGAVALSTRGIYHSAAAGNRETLALCEESGGTLLPAAVLDPRILSPETLLPGARLIALFPATQDWPVTLATLTAALKALAGRGVRVPLLVEASRPGDATALQAMLLRAGYVGPAILAGVDCDTLAEALTLAYDDPQFFVCTDRLRGIGEVALAVARVGADRVLFGSGAIARNSLGAALATIRAAELSPAERNSVLAENTRRLLAAGGRA